MTQYVDFLLYDDAVGLDITGPLEVLNTASILLRQNGVIEQAYRARFWAQSVGLVRLSSGLCVQADHALGEAMKSDILIVPGTVDPELIIKNSAFLNAVKHASKQAKRIVSVCTGAFILAACGLLDGRQATTHWLQTDLLAARYPRIKVVPNAIYTRDGAISTSAGVTAGIDLALALVEEDYGAELAIEISRCLVVYLRRPGGQTQFSAPLELEKKAGERFSKLHSWLLQNLDQPVAVEDLAEQVDMSPRNFSRVFSKMTGITPGKYVESIRLERARELLESGNPPINRVAQLSGFGREERMRRAFIRELGVTPGLYQSHFGR